MTTTLGVKAGDIFTRLTVVEKIGRDKTKSFSGSRCICLCACGAKVTVSTQSLKKGDTKSCGCLYKETRGRRIHGLCKHPLYKRWRYMVDRCSINNKSWTAQFYSKRGIKVCKRWLKFTNFYKDNIEGFRAYLQIDRINNNKGYSPKNCRWVDRKTQCRNTRQNHFLTFNKKTLTIAEWSSLQNISTHTLRYRVRNGWSTERALTQPVCHR